jgi:hypothetical protein
MAGGRAGECIACGPSFGAKRESGALIRAGVAGSAGQALACSVLDIARSARGWQKGQKGQKVEKARENGHRKQVAGLANNRQKWPESPVATRGSALGNRGNSFCEGTACRPIGATSRADREGRVTVRVASIAIRESGALIRAGIASSACRGRELA